MPQHRRRHTWNTVIKIGFSLAFLGVIAYRLVSERDLPALWESFIAQWKLQGAWLVVLVFCMMPLNWLLETKKWLLLLRPGFRMSLMPGLRAITGGIALSLFTPNRIGEYGGRILFVPPQHNWRAVLATLVGSLSQNLVHVSVGLLAIWFLLSHSVELPINLDGILGIIAVGICLVLYVIYFNIGRVGNVLGKRKGRGMWKKLWEACTHLEKITRSELTQALGISFVRYVVFSMQFVLLLHYFDIGVPIIWLCVGVAAMYLMQTSIPLPPFVDLVARSELAILIWAAYDVNELTVLAASFFIWIINLLIPAFFGLLAIGSVNVLQSLGYGNTKDPLHTTHDAHDPAGHAARGSGE